LIRWSGQLYDIRHIVGRCGHIVRPYRAGIIDAFGHGAIQGKAESIARRQLSLLHLNKIAYRKDIGKGGFRHGVGPRAFHAAVGIASTQYFDDKVPAAGILYNRTRYAGVGVRDKGGTSARNTAQGHKEDHTSLHAKGFLP